MDALDFRPDDSSLRAAFDDAIRRLRHRGTSAATFLGGGGSGRRGAGAFEEGESDGDENDNDDDENDNDDDDEVEKESAETAAHRWAEAEAAAKRTLGAVRASARLGDLVKAEAAHWRRASGGLLSFDEKALADGLARVLEPFRVPLASLFASYCLLCATTTTNDATTNDATTRTHSPTRIHELLTITGSDFLMLCLGLGLIPRSHSAAGCLVDSARGESVRAMGNGGKKRRTCGPLWWWQVMERRRLHRLFYFFLSSPFDSFFDWPNRLYAPSRSAPRPGTSCSIGVLRSRHN